MKAVTGRHGVVGGGMVWKAMYVKQGDLHGVMRVFIAENPARRAGRGEVRASVVAMKRGNARRAKGRRKVDA